MENFYVGEIWSVIKRAFVKARYDKSAVHIFLSKEKDNIPLLRLKMKRCIFDKT